MNNVTLWRKTAWGWELLEEIPNPLPEMSPKKVLLADSEWRFLCEIEIENGEEFEDTSVEN